VIPSNGGLDLKVVRNYQSFQKVQGVQVPERNYQKGRTATGVGWDLHFGRLWRGSNSASSPQLAATNTVNSCQIFNVVTSRDNPVLELPDGSRQTFAVGTPTSPYAYISPGRWILKCLPTALDTYATAVPSSSHRKVSSTPLISFTEYRAFPLVVTSIRAHPITHSRDKD